jgi:hypothetical protein
MLTPVRLGILDGVIPDGVIAVTSAVVGDALQVLSSIL